MAESEATRLLERQRDALNDLLDATQDRLAAAEARLSESEVLRSLREDWLNEMSRAEVAEARAEAAEQALRQIAEQGSAARPGVPWVHWCEIARAALDGREETGDG